MKIIRLVNKKTVNTREKCMYSELFWSGFSSVRTEYGEIRIVSLCIRSECGKMRTRITPNMDTFYAVSIHNGWNNKYGTGQTV